MPITPAFTRTPIDPGTNPSQPLGIHSTWPTEPQPPTASSSSSTTAEEEGKQPPAAADSTAPSSSGSSPSPAETGPSSEELSRQEKLGILLVQLGVADEKRIFGSSPSPSLQAYREGRIPGLMGSSSSSPPTTMAQATGTASAPSAGTNVPQTVASVPLTSTAPSPAAGSGGGGKSWFKPWTWFSRGRGAVVSGDEGADAATVAATAAAAVAVVAAIAATSATSAAPALGASGENQNTATQPSQTAATHSLPPTSTTPPSPPTPQPAAVAAAGGATGAKASPPKSTAPSSGGGKTKLGTPSVNTAPLTEQQAAQLTANVRADRDKLLAAEQHVHDVLQGLEDTRFKYLVPSADLPCDREVEAVVKCYVAKNAEAENRREAVRKRLQAEMRRDYMKADYPLSLAEKKGSAGVADVPIVAFDALQCGPQVKQLRLCTDRMLEAYSKQDTS